MKQMLFVLTCASMLTYNLTGMQTSKSLLKDNSTQNCIHLMLHKNGLPESEMCIANQISVNPVLTLQGLSKETECDEPILRELFLRWNLPENLFVYLALHLRNDDPTCPLDAWDAFILDEKQEDQSEYEKTDIVSRTSDDISDTHSVLMLSQNEEDYANSDIKTQEDESSQQEKAYHHSLENAAIGQDDLIWQILQAKKDRADKRARDVYKKVHRIAQQQKADRAPHHR